MNATSLPSIQSTQQETLRSFASSLTCIYDGRNKSSPMCPLSSFFSPSAESSATCVVPSLSLKVSNSSRIYTTNSKCQRKHEAAHRLRTPLLLAGNSRTDSAPNMLLRNLSFSFSWMLKKRLQSTSQDIVGNHSNLTRDFEVQTKVGRLVSKLTNSRKLISLSSASIEFSPLRVGEYFVNVSGPEIMVLPLVFQGTFKVVIMGRHEVAIKVEAPGTITGYFAGHGNFLEHVKVDIDADYLLEQMLGHCRDVARKTFSILAKVASRDSIRVRRAQRKVPPVSRSNGGDGQITAPRPSKIQTSTMGSLMCSSPGSSISNKEVDNLICRVKQRRTESLTVAWALILLMQ